MKNKFALIALIFLLAMASVTTAQHHNSDKSEPLNKLITGNTRYFEGKAIHSNQTLERVKEVSKGQAPFAVIVGCSDSRVPPEIIFDQGIGDLFIIRTAGNVVDDIALASIEYAVAHLHVELIVVLGHESCGAVTAAVSGGEAEGHISEILKLIEPAVAEAKRSTGDLLENSITANVKQIVKQLSHSKPILEEFIHKKELTIVGARYDLDSGIVSIIE